MVEIAAPLLPNLLRNHSTFKVELGVFEGAGDSCNLGGAHQGPLGGHF